MSSSNSCFELKLKLFPEYFLAENASGRLRRENYLKENRENQKNEKSDNNNNKANGNNDDDNADNSKMEPGGWKWRRRGVVVVGQKNRMETAEIYAQASRAELNWTKRSSPELRWSSC